MLEISFFFYVHTNKEIKRQTYVSNTHCQSNSVKSGLWSRYTAITYILLWILQEKCSLAQGFFKLFQVNKMENIIFKIILMKELKF